MLRSMRIRSSVFCRSRMTAPWGFGVAARDVAAFHILTTGAAYARVEGVEETIRLEAGDMVLLPTGRAHQVTDDPASPVTALDDILDANPVVAGTLRHGGGGAESRVLCGGFHIEHHEANPLLRSLPAFIHVSGA